MSGGVFESLQLRQDNALVIQGVDETCITFKAGAVVLQRLFIHAESFVAQSSLKENLWVAWSALQCLCIFVDRFFQLAAGSKQITSLEHHQRFVRISEATA